MDRKDCLPLFFAASIGDGSYKVYQNEIYQAFDSLGFPANVLWPVADDGVSNISLGALTKVAAPAKVHYSFTRKWNGKTYSSFSWTHSGSEVELNIDGETRVIPVLVIERGEILLPFNTCVMQPKGRSASVARAGTGPGAR